MMTLNTKIIFNQVEMLIRLQTQRARDSEFNTTSVVITQALAVDETVTEAGEQLNKKKPAPTNGETVKN